VTVQPLRRVFRVVNGGTPTSEPDNWDGEVAWATPIDLGRLNGARIRETRRTLTTTGLRTGSSLVPAGSLIVSTRAPIGYVAETTTPMAFNQGCRGLVPLTELDVRFFRYQLLVCAGQLQSRGQGSTFVELSTDGLASFPLAVPPLREQRAIADYLDAETARIDEVRGRRTAMARLLEEWEQRRLCDLLGDWRSSPTVTLRQVGTKLVTGPFGTQLSASEYTDGGTPVVNPTHISDGRVVPDPLVTVPHDVADRLDRHRLSPGDIVMGRKGDVGRAAVIGSSEAGWICGSDSIAVRTDHRMLLPEFLALTLSVAYYRQQLESRSTGATITNVNESILMAFQVPAVSRHDQRQIVERGAAIKARRLQGVRLFEEQARLLLERRQALITAAVTGQLAIPGVAA
jgi:type I restriction enzyme S subunit